jgi:FtsZ-binding cell division protein ZapB
MWTDEQRRRYHFLCEREQTNELTTEEAVELAALARQLCEAEAAYLAPANERKGQEIAELSAAVERLEAENRQLREYLSERLGFLERVKSIVARIEAEDQEIRQADPTPTT